jgi:ketosteroid isomerase-like protein
MPDTAHAPGTSPRAVFDRMRAALGADDRHAFADLIAPDGVVEWPFHPPGMSHRLEGREAFREFVTQSGLAGLLRFEELRADAVHETADPEVIIVETTTIGSVVETGARFALRAIAVLRIRDGEIVSYRDYVDPTAAPRALDADAGAGAA